MSINDGVYRILVQCNLHHLWKRTDDHCPMEAIAVEIQEPHCFGDVLEVNCADERIRVENECRHTRQQPREIDGSAERIALQVEPREIRREVNQVNGALHFAPRQSEFGDGGREPLQRDASTGRGRAIRISPGDLSDLFVAIEANARPRGDVGVPVVFRAGGFRVEPVDKHFEECLVGEVGVLDPSKFGGDDGDQSKHSKLLKVRDDNGRVHFFSRKIYEMS